MTPPRAVAPVWPPIALPIPAPAAVPRAAPPRVEVVLSQPVRQNNPIVSVMSVSIFFMINLSY